MANVKININVSIVANTVAQFKEAIDSLRKSEVLVGVPADKAKRSAAARDPLPINNATIAYIQNYGSPAANIPARPFMEPGIKDAQQDISSRMADTARAALDGTAIAKGLNATGLVAQNAIRNRINSNTPPPLAPGTLAGRRRRGRTGTNTLVDTGQLRNSISYVVKESK